MTTMRSFLFISLIFVLSTCRNSPEQAAVIEPDVSCGCESLTDTLNYVVDRNPDSLTRYYLAIWKRKFLERNGISETQFTDVIRNVNGTLFSWQDGVSLRVDYQYQLDWLTIRHVESFRVLYDPETTKSYAVTVPRGVYLTESQILFQLPWADNQPIRFPSKLAFSSCESACQALRTKTGFAMLKTERVSLYPPPTLPVTRTAEPYLFANGNIDSTANRCVFGRINLLTGETQAEEGPCLVRLFCIAHQTYSFLGSCFTTCQISSGQAAFIHPLL